MEDTPAPAPSAPAAAVPQAPPDIPEKPSTEIPPSMVPRPGHKYISRPLFALLILAAFLPVATAAVLIRQSISGEAASGLFCRYKVTSVMISPGQIDARENGPNVYLSALAYDKNNQPIWSGITYQWGMSSTTSIGNLIPENQIATFVPRNAGTGDVYVTASYCKNKKVTASVSAVVLPAPTAAPTPTPTLIPEPSPTATPSLSPSATVSATPMPLLLPP